MSDRYPDRATYYIDGHPWRDTPLGYGITYRENGAGGRTYYCDDIGGGRVVWDTCICSEPELWAVLAWEAQLRCEERVAKEALERNLRPHHDAPEVPQRPDERASLDADHSRDDAEE